MTPLPKLRLGSIELDFPVVQAALSGYSDWPMRVIAKRLKIAEQTVRNYTSLIFSKLGIVNRIEILKYTEKIQYYLEHY